ncbi:MAG: IS630 family transposase [Opitutales bacterium]|nr:IS630 family transposase [Opitutales bacterium]MCH8541776.1 IS630 family transposase [Opitutales bacterium]
MILFNEALDYSPEGGQRYPRDWSLYRQGGEDGIRLGKRGRPAGLKRRLTPRQESAIQRAITDKTPDQLKMPFALWTRQAIGELIQRRYEIKLPVRTLGEYLKRWGFTPQKPKRKEYSQQPEAVRKWLDEQYPAIKAKARQEKADIYWGDETGVNNQDQTGRGYAPRGKTPIRQAMAKKVSTSMISAVTNKGQLRFMVYQGGMNNDIFIKFLSRLIKSSSKKVFLIVDNLRVHKSKKVKQWLDDHKKETRVYYLPPYCPELNPDEYLNNTLKKQLENHPPASAIAEQQERIRSQMRSNQKRPNLVISLFSATNVKYAA